MSRALGWRAPGVPDRRYARLFCFLAVAALTAACQRRGNDEPTPAAPAATESPEAAPPPPAPKPWYVGTWRARLEWTAGAPTEGAGLPPEWREDAAPTEASELTLHVDEARNVDGLLEGPFSLAVRGSMDEETLRAELEPRSSDADDASEQVRGTLIAARTAEEALVLVGTVRLSSGDSLLVRHAKVSLERASESPRRAP